MVLLLRKHAAVSIGIGIIEIMQIPFDIEDQQLQITTSIGICLYPHHGEDISTLLKNADIALYQTKEKDKNGYHLFAVTE